MNLADDIKPKGIIQYGLITLFLAVCLSMAFGGLATAPGWDRNACMSDPESLRDFGTVGTERKCNQADPMLNVYWGFGLGAFVAFFWVLITLNVLRHGETG